MPLLKAPTLTHAPRTVNGVTVDSWLVYCGTTVRNGKTVGVRAYRKSEADARAYAADYAKRVKAVGDAAAKLTREQIYDAAAALKALSDAGATQTLVSVVAQWLGRRGGASTRDVACGAAVAAYVKRLNADTEHAGSVRRALTALVATVGTRKAVAAVGKAQVAAWLDGVESPKSHNLKRGYALAWLNWCRKQGNYPDDMLQECRAIEEKPEPYVRPCTFDAATVERIMRAAEALPDAEDVVPRLALAFFAGVRTAEIGRLRWRDIKIRDGDIRIESPKGIVGTPPRFVTITPNLKAWLIRYQQDDAAPVCKLSERAFAVRKAVACKAAGVTWTTGENRNVARHTFASMHVAQHRDLRMTAVELGHGESLVMLKQHYHGTAERGDAAAFWNIMPKGASV